MTKTTRQQAFNKAKAEVKDTKYTRPNKYIKWYLGNQKTTEKPSWCGMFVAYVFKKLCNDPALLEGCQNMAYVPNIYNWAKSKNKLTKKPELMDLIIFDWEVNGKLDRDHVGFFVKDLGNGYIQTLEGNTSNASNGDGDCVQIRKRSKSYVGAYIKLDYKDEAKEVKVEPNKTYQTLIQLNLRDKNATSGKALCKIPSGQRFTGKPDKNGWLKVEYKGKNGYIRVKSETRIYAKEVK